MYLSIYSTGIYVNCSGKRFVYVYIIGIRYGTGSTGTIISKEKKAILYVKYNESDFRISCWKSD